MFSGKIFLLRTLFGLTVVVCFALTAPATFGQVDQWGVWKNGVTESWWMSSRTFTNADLESAVERWNQIGTANSGELSFEGDYFVGGETHGTYLRWSKANGFLIADIDKCQALVMSVSYGRVESTPDGIKFLPEFAKPSKGNGHQHAPKETATMSFVPLKWKDRLYLIPQDEVNDFADYAAGLGEFNTLNAFDSLLESSYFYSKYADKDSYFGDTPAFPPTYQALIKKPIVATIIAIDGRSLRHNYSYEVASKILSTTIQHDRASLTFVKLNVGSVHGARSGLFLRVTKPDLGEAVRLIDVGPTWSRGVLVRSLEGGKATYHDGQNEKEYPPISVGWKLTTELR